MIIALKLVKPLKKNLKFKNGDYPSLNIGCIFLSSCTQAATKTKSVVKFQFFLNN